MAELNSVSWGDVIVFFITVFGIFGVSIGSWYIYNSIFGTLWDTKEKKLRDAGVQKGEDGVWRIKTDKTLSHETEVDKAQRGFIKAMQSSSFSNSSKAKKGKKAE